MLQVHWDQISLRKWFGVVLRSCTLQWNVLERTLSANGWTLQIKIWQNDARLSNKLACQPWVTTVEYSSKECLLLLASDDRDKVITRTRCLSWKAGTETGMGLNKYPARKSHIQAISMCVERHARVKSCSSADLALSRDLVSRNSYYLLARAVEPRPEPQ